MRRGRCCDRAAARAFRGCAASNRTHYVREGCRTRYGARNRTRREPHAAGRAESRTL